MSYAKARNTKKRLKCDMTEEKKEKKRSEEIKKLRKRTREIRGMFELGSGSSLSLAAKAKLGTNFIS